MGGGHAFRKLVYAGNRHNDIHYRSLPEIHFTASRFFLKTFDRLCIFVFVSFWSFFFFFFFCGFKHYEKQKKKSRLAYKETEMDRNKIRSGDKIQNGGDYKFCRLTSRVA